MTFRRAISWFLMVVGCGGGPPGEEAPGPADRADGGRATDVALDTRPSDASAVKGPTPGWSDAVRPREAVDLSADPRTFEMKLEARVAPVSFRPGTTSPAWTYDGGVPGPLIRVRVGDRLIVHFTNRLPEPTTIHWHGLRIPVEMDGVPDHPLPPVAPGQTFRYDFVVPDPGLFWYHPHFRSAAQVGDGLYGPLLVEDPDEPAGLGDELVVVLSDISVDDEGRLRPPGLGGDIATLFGREGELLLANGRAGSVLKARVGRRQRWRIVNAAKSRYFTLAMEGQRFLRIGGDGGRLPRPLEVERPVVIPGERLDLLWTPEGEPGRELAVRWIPTERGYGSTFARAEETIFKVRFTDDPPETAPALPRFGRAIAPLDLAGATPMSIKLTRNDIDKRFYLGVNGLPFGGHEPLKARIGETQIWTIENAMDWAHPFHLHGFFYQVLDGDGRHLPEQEWKDSADVPAKKTLKIAVKFDERPGTWMFHCHILDHADAGMMGMVEVKR